MTDILKNYGGAALKGLLITSAPSIGKGILVELLHQYKIDVKLVTKLVTENKSLWGVVGQDFYNSLRQMLEQVGNVDWFNTDWAIEAMKEEHSALASLFLGWRKARNWLERQIDEIKE